MRVVTWNVNSIRARQQRVLDWLVRHQPDVALLQETKCTDEAFAADEITGAYEALGYEVAHHGHDHWNGVAILSRVGLTDVVSGFPGVNRPPYDEARVISATCADVRMWSVYAPNGRELDDPHYLFKLVWFERLRAAVAADPSGAPTLLAGDMNVAPTSLDIYDPARWKRRTHTPSPPEHAAVALVELGFRDVMREVHPGPDVYTWWSYRPGQFRGQQGTAGSTSPCAPVRSRTGWNGCGSTWDSAGAVVSTTRRGDRPALTATILNRGPVSLVDRPARQPWSRRRSSVMRTFVRRSVAAVLIIHGALHVLGDGLAWTVAAGVLVASGVLLLFDQRQWWRLGAVGVALSQIVVVADWHVAWAGTIVNVVLMAAVVHGMR